MKEFSTTWNKSKNRSKQRKYRLKAPLHVKQKFIAAALTKDQRGKLGKRSLTVRVGDKVKIMRGQFKKKVGKVERIDLKNAKVFVADCGVSKKDGSVALYPISPSNVQIQEPVMDDKKRRGAAKKTQPKQPAAKAEAKPQAKPESKSQTKKESKGNNNDKKSS